MKSILALLLITQINSQTCPILQCSASISGVSQTAEVVNSQTQTVIDLINSYKPVVVNYTETTCFKHPGLSRDGARTNIVSGIIQTYSCPKGGVCNLQMDEIAWFNSAI